MVEAGPTARKDYVRATGEQTVERRVTAVQDEHRAPSRSD